MNFSTAVKTCFSKYATFSGRAQRSEFWWFVLFVMGVNFILTFVDSFLFGTVTTMPGGFSASTNTPYLSGLFMLVTFLPNISVAVRRLHDTDRSGWWYWIALVPIIGFIMLIVWFASKGTQGTNRFGPDPLGGRSYEDGLAAGRGYADSDIPSVPRD